METVRDSSPLTINDRFGYTCYAFVFPASPEIAAKVTAIERASKMTRAKIPAHLTVKGTFHEVADLGRVRSLAREVIADTRRFRVSFDGAKVKYREDGSGALHVPTTPEMQRLHDALVAAIRSSATTVYDDDPYLTHMTLYTEATREGVAIARDLIKETDFGPGFEAFAIDLMGRRGPAYGGQWELIERFPFA